MSSWEELLIPDPIDLTRPIRLIVNWDGQGASLVDTIDRYKRTLEIFTAHLRDGAFLRATAPSEPLLTPDKSYLSVQQQRFEITFPGFPYQVQSLRLLIRALLYPHRRVGSRVEVLVSGTPVEGNLAAAPFLLRNFQDLDQPLPESNVHFQSSIQWCYKNLTLAVQFRQIIDDEAVEILDQIVANWVIFGNLGAYATEDQLEYLDEDEEIGMFLDIPIVCEDSIEWSITQLNIRNECVIPLVNMLSSFHRKEANIFEVQIN